MKAEAAKTLGTSVLSVSAVIVSSAPQQACVFLVYSIAFLVARGGPCQFQLQVSFGFPGSTPHARQAVCVPPG